MSHPIDHGIPWKDISHLLDQMAINMQHLEIEVVRAEYNLRFHMPPSYDEYLLTEIFSGIGDRYQCDSVYDDHSTLYPRKGGLP